MPKVNDNPTYDHVWRAAQDKYLADIATLIASFGSLSDQDRRVMDQIDALVKEAQVHSAQGFGVTKPYSAVPDSGPNPFPGPAVTAAQKAAKVEAERVAAERATSHVYDRNKR